jgi:hypothetical protein
MGRHAATTGPPLRGSLCLTAFVINGVASWRDRCGLRSNVARGHIQPDFRGNAIAGGCALPTERDARAAASRAPGMGAAASRDTGAGTTIGPTIDPTIGPTIHPQQCSLCLHYTPVLRSTYDVPRTTYHVRRTTYLLYLPARIFLSSTPYCAAAPSMYSSIFCSSRAPSGVPVVRSSTMAPTSLKYQG